MFLGSKQDQVLMQVVELYYILRRFYLLAAARMVSVGSLLGT